MDIILMGMPASGKSTIGKSLAELLNVPFIDTDKYFNFNLSEEEFRKQERKFVDRLFEKDNKGTRVIALGGGILNLEFTEGEEVISFYLKVRLNKLYERIKKEPRKFLNINSLDDLKKLYKERNKYYKRANYTITGSMESTFLRKITFTLLERIFHDKIG